MKIPKTDKFFIFFLIIGTFLICLISGQSIAKSGVSSIIENNKDDFSEFDNDGGGFVQLEISIDKMSDAVSANIGLPEANMLVLLLFSLAALLQTARVISGQGNWLSFVIRVIVVLAFLRAFTPLFSGIETFFTYLGDQILGNESAFDVLWEAQDSILNKFSSEWDAAQGAGTWTFIKYFSKNSLVYGLVLISYVFSYAIYILIYLVQACIIITLKYLGPILIALSIIPEVDFSESYIKSLFQVLSWTIVASIMIKIMSTIPVMGLASQVGFSDFMSIIAMNICFAFGFMFIPKIAEMIFSGKGWGGFGASITGVAGGKMINASIKGVEKEGNGAKSVIGASIGAGKWVHEKIRSARGNSTKNIIGNNPSTQSRMTSNNLNDQKQNGKQTAVKAT